MSPERARKGKTLEQTVFNQRVEVYEVKKQGLDKVAVRAESNTTIGKISIFFETHSPAVSPRVGEDILVSITIPADAVPSASAAPIALDGSETAPGA